MMVLIKAARVPQETAGLAAPALLSADDQADSGGYEHPLACRDEDRHGQADGNHLNDAGTRKTGTPLKTPVGACQWGPGTPAGRAASRMGR